MNLHLYTKELGVTRMAMPTNGNAGAALSAYCSRCGMETFIFAPEDTPVGQCKLDPSLKATCFQPLNLRVHTVLST